MKLHKAVSVTCALLVAIAMMIPSIATFAQSEVSGKLTIMVWGTPTDVNSIETAIGQFKELNPEVEIEVMVGDCGVSFGACKPLVAADSMPDVFVPGIWTYNAFVNAGLLEKLDSFIERDELNPADFLPVAWDAMLAQEDGSVYALPMGLNVQSLYYNKDMFDAAGLDYPPADGDYTWHDVREWAKKLTLDKNGNNAESPDFDPDKIVQWGVYLRHTEPIMLAFGGSTMSLPDRKKCNIEHPDSIRALQFYQDVLYQDHTAVTPRDEQEEEGYLRWIGGTVAMQMGSHEQTTIRNDRNPDLNYDIAPLPKEKAGNATFTQFHMWSIWKNSQNKEAAWALVKYLATDGSVGDFGTIMGLIPAYKDLAYGPAFLGAPNEPEHLKEGQLDPLSWPLASYPSFFSDRTDLIEGQDGLGPVLEAIKLNRKPAAEAVQGICETIDKLMSE